MKPKIPRAASPFMEVDQCSAGTVFPVGMPPTRTILRMDPPPLDNVSTTAQLKADINSGSTGDKIGVFDPAMSPLGTDDEAAGTPASPERIQLARYLERTARWATCKLHGTAHTTRDSGLLVYIGVISVIGIVLVCGIIGMNLVWNPELTRVSEQ